MNQANESVLRRSFNTGRVGRQTKFQEICGRITDLAYELGPDAKLPTVLKLRDTLGVSIATLNAVLSELESQHILIRKHGVGIYVSPEIRRYRVCLICDPGYFQSVGTSPFWGLLLEHTRRRAEAERETFSLHFALDATEGAKTKNRATDLFATPYLPEAIVEEIRGGRIDGIFGVGLPPMTVEWIERQGIPFVAFAGTGEFVVERDVAQSIQLAVAALVDQQCQRIGGWFSVPPHQFVAGGAEHPDLPTFRTALEQYNLPFDADVIWDNTHLVPDSGGMHTLSYQEQGYHAVMELFGPHTDRSEWCDGIYSDNEAMTQGVLAAFQRLEIRVGEEVKVATLANTASPALIGYEDRIIRIEIDPADIVARMFGILEALLHRQEVTQGITKISPKLLMASQ